MSAQGIHNPPPSLASAAFNDDTGGEHDDCRLGQGEGIRVVDSPIPRGRSAHPNSGRLRINTIPEADRDPAGGVGAAARGH